MHVQSQDCTIMGQSMLCAQHTHDIAPYLGVVFCKEELHVGYWMMVMGWCWGVHTYTCTCILSGGVLTDLYNTHCFVVYCHYEHEMFRILLSITTCVYAQAIQHVGKSSAWILFNCPSNNVVCCNLCDFMTLWILFQTGATALYIASQNNHEKVIELLLKSGANVDLSRTVRNGFSTSWNSKHCQYIRN